MQILSTMLYKPKTLNDIPWQMNQKVILRSYWYAQKQKYHVFYLPVLGLLNDAFTISVESVTDRKISE